MIKDSSMQLSIGSIGLGSNILDELLDLGEVILIRSSGGGRHELGVGGGHILVLSVKNYGLPAQEITGCQLLVDLGLRICRLSFRAHGWLGFRAHGCHGWIWV